MLLTRWLNTLSGRILGRRTRTRSAGRRGSLRGTSLATRTASWIVASNSPGHSPEFGEVAERLEERCFLSVSPVFAVDTLTITFGTASDQAYVSYDGANFDVGTSEGANDLYDGTDPITKIVVVDGGANASQIATFSGSTAFPGVLTNLTVTGIETSEVKQSIPTATVVSGNASTVNVTAPGQIQDGIDLAASGATVNVAAGTYTENLLLNKVLTLKGAQFGVDARGRVATESIVTPLVAGNTTLDITTGSGASVIDGFTFSGGTALGMLRSTASAINDNLQILNNRFDGFTGAAIFLDKPGIDITVSQNYIDAGSKTSGGATFHLDTDGFDGLHLTNNTISKIGVAAPGTAIFSDGNHNIGASAGRNPLISGNLIENHNKLRIRFRESSSRNLILCSTN